MKSHRKSPTPEQKAAAQARRAELMSRTRPLQAARNSGLLPWAELPTINACLELIYAGETGQTEWKTFLGWKEAGFGVAKGESPRAAAWPPRPAVGVAQAVSTR